VARRFLGVVQQQNARPGPARSQVQSLPPRRMQVIACFN